MYYYSMLEKFEVTKYIKRCLKIRFISSVELARRLGITKQNLWNRYKRNDIRISDLERIANVLECKLQIDFIDVYSGRPLTDKEVRK